MKKITIKKTALAAAMLASSALLQPAFAGQAPGAANAPDIPVSSHDRVYLSDQSSNTVSVVDPATEKLLGVIRLGDPAPGNLSPLYKGQLLVHGMGYSADHRTLDVVSIGSNSVTFIDTATNRVKHTTYVGRSPHEAFFTPDGREVWVTVRGENYIQVLDGKTYEPTKRIMVPNGPGMTIFSPDGKYGYIVSSFTPEMVVVDTKSHKIVGNVKQASPFSPDLAATPDGKQVWLTLKDIGKTQVINARPPFNTLAVLDTGAVTNHVNIARNASGQFAYVTVGGLNEVKVFTTSDKPELVATIPVGALPHGLWPSGDGTRIYVGLENGNGVAAIDTASNKVISTIASGQSPQGMVYIPNAVPEGAGTDNLMPLGASGDAVHLTMGPPGSQATPTTVTVNNQGLVDQLQAAATGLEPKKPYVLALSTHADGSGPLEPIAKFMGNPAGAGLVSTLGPLRKAVDSNTQGGGVERRYLVIATVTADGTPGEVVQVQR
jgi:YVTN family beta-propeller protein